MADRCEHGARRGTCDEKHNTNNESADTLERALGNLRAFDTKRMSGVDVIFLGHAEDAIEKVIETLRREA